MNFEKVITVVLTETEADLLCEAASDGSVHWTHEDKALLEGAFVKMGVALRDGPFTCAPPGRNTA